MPPAAVPHTLTATDHARFTARITRAPNGCWPWQGALDNGYGRFWCQRRALLAHRVSWQLHHGPIPDEMQLDHLCRNRACVNPQHLEPVAIAVNVLRGAGRSAVNARKQLCRRGHPLAGANLYVTPRGARQCVTCQRDRVRRWRAKAAT